MAAVDQPLIRKSRFAINVPLAGWVLSVCTFFLGSIIAPLYERLSYDTVSVGEPFDVRGVNTDDRFPVINFETELKVANAGKSAITIESVQSPDLRSSSVSFHFISAQMGIMGKSLNLPFDPPITDKDSGFPILIKPESAELLQLQLHYRYTNERGANIIEDLQRLVEQEGIPIALRVNGKLRDYKLRAQPFARYLTPTKHDAGSSVVPSSTNHQTVKPATR